jgi:hypothetical protein
MRNLITSVAVFLAVVFALAGWCGPGTALAQMHQDFGGGPPPEEAMAAILAIIVFVVLIALAISLAISIVICLLLSGCLSKLPPEHRVMEPGMVWLLLIPFFNIVWNFFVFIRISKSYQSYFAAQGKTQFGDCGEQIGLWYCICCVACMVPMVNYIAGPAGLVLLIVYLVKVLGLKGEVG